MTWRRADCCESIAPARPDAAFIPGERVTGRAARATKAVFDNPGAVGALHRAFHGELDYKTVKQERAALKAAPKAESMA